MSTSVNPVFSMAGVMPASPQMTHWHTAYPHPEPIDNGRLPCSGPSFSTAGVMPGTPEVTHWPLSQLNLGNPSAIFAHQLEHVRLHGISGRGALPRGAVLALPAPLDDELPLKAA